MAKLVSKLSAFTGTIDGITYYAKRQAGLSQIGSTH
ncbi:hypothetical protein DSL99_3023 [Leeuwenhoekiella marinoflava]|uniref:Uncharacterized protein n=1 Tax=Leeuwenhoekiella marinoflava TaxID=988 RepID=A0A4Q0PJ79_9FLAO|nr:hypothetical protein DSL99_3023 [Leeuwenhoekiella marinoflava]